MATIGFFSEGTDIQEIQRLTNELIREVGADLPLLVEDGVNGPRSMLTIQRLIPFLKAAGGIVPDPPDDRTDSGLIVADTSQCQSLVVTNKTEGGMTDREVRRWVNIAKEYRDRFIVPHWPYFNIDFATNPEPGNPWEVEIRPTSGLNGAIGYHAFRLVQLLGGGTDVDPFAVVGIAGGNGLKTLLHELEMLADAGVNMVGRINDDVDEYVEFADPTQGDPGPIVQGEETINIVTPAWHNPYADTGFDIMGLCTQPREVRPGGFSIRLDRITKTFSHRLHGGRIRPANSTTPVPDYLPAHAFEIPEALASKVAA